MEFFLRMHPPTTTAQMKKVQVVNGKPIFYEPPKLKAAKNKLIAFLSMYKPQKPYTGAVALRVLWLFPKGKSHKNGEWRTSRPDTDNLQKMLKDCMTKLGYWKDDALVVRELVEKKWADEPGGIRIKIVPLEGEVNECK